MILVGLVAAGVLMAIMTTVMGTAVALAWRPMLYGGAALGALAAGAWLLGYRDAAFFFCLLLAFVPVFGLEWESGS
jgi:hypothetical protein